MTLEKVNVLILGGVGFIGRNFIHYLLSNNLVAEIRVADKMLPQTAYLSETFKAEFSRIEFKQSNLINQGNNEKKKKKKKNHSHFCF
jgi:dTDP-D-glucose 4,6-dehydratase